MQDRSFRAPSLGLLCSIPVRRTYSTRH